MTCGGIRSKVIRAEKSRSLGDRKEIPRLKVWGALGTNRECY
jgi:hypothetical protein